MQIFLIILAVGVLALSAWDLRDGSFDSFSKNSRQDSLSESVQSDSLPESSQEELSPIPPEKNKEPIVSIKKLFGNKYSVLEEFVETMPFVVLAPTYIPRGYNFLDVTSRNLVATNFVGIPQMIYMHETSTGKSKLTARQFDRVRYEKEVFEEARVSDFEAYMKSIQARSVEQNGQTLYVNISEDKVQTIFGDYLYLASGYMMRNDSVLEVAYNGNGPFSEEKIIKILLSFEPF